MSHSKEYNRLGDKKGFALTFTWSNEEWHGNEETIYNLENGRKSPKYHRNKLNNNGIVVFT